MTTINIKFYQDKLNEILERNATHIEIGNLFIEAKKNLKHGEWQKFIDGNLPINPRTVQMYMQIARKFAKARHVAVMLPRDTKTVSILSQLPDEAITQKNINPDMSRHEAQVLVDSYKEKTEEELLYDRLSYLFDKIQHGASLIAANTDALGDLLGKWPKNRHMPNASNAILALTNMVNQVNRVLKTLT